jgi:hypothetical protein
MVRLGRSLGRDGCVQPSPAEGAAEAGRAHSNPRTRGGLNGSDLVEGVAAVVALAVRVDERPHAVAAARA